MTEEDNGENCRVEVSIGSVSVEASASTAEEAQSIADKQFKKAISSAEGLGVFDDYRTYHLEGGAGWLMAHGDGDTPEEAYERWEDMWEKMISDVQKLEAREKERAGIKR